MFIYDLWYPPSNLHPPEVASEESAAWGPIPPSPSPNIKVPSVLGGYGDSKSRLGGLSNFNG